MWFDILKAPVQMELDIDPNMLSMPHGMREPKPKITQIPEKNTTNISEQSNDGGSDDGGSDDSDVGEEWRNLRGLMNKNPRGAKKKELTKVISLLIRTATEPTYQKDLAIQA